MRTLTTLRAWSLWICVVGTALLLAFSAFDPMIAALAVSAVGVFFLRALLKVRAQLKAHEELVSVQLFSALKHSGHEELVQVLNAWLTDVSVYEGE